MKYILFQQWGYRSTTANNTTPVIFPVSLKKNYVTFAMHSGTGSAVCIENYTTHTLLGVQIIVRDMNGIINTGWIVYWFVIGV